MVKTVSKSNNAIRCRAIEIVQNLIEGNRLTSEELSTMRCFCMIENEENINLEYYEKLEERGILMKMPCAKYNLVYKVIYHEYEWYVVKMIVLDISPFGKIHDGEVWNVYLEAIDYSMTAYCSFSDFGKTVFLSAAEAEVAMELIKKQSTVM